MSLELFSLKTVIVFITAAPLAFSAPSPSISAGDKVFTGKWVAMDAMCFAGIDSRWTNTPEHVFFVAQLPEVVRVYAPAIIADVIQVLRGKTPLEGHPRKTMGRHGNCGDLDFPVTASRQCSLPLPAAVRKYFDPGRDILLWVLPVSPVNAARFAPVADSRVVASFYLSGLTAYATRSKPEKALSPVLFQKYGPRHCMDNLA